MKIRTWTLIATLVVLTASLARAENWTQFRGPRGDGSSAEKGLPLKWSATENVAWKVAIPGRGHSSPVIWGDRIFVTAATNGESAADKVGERLLYCLDRKSGKILWHQTVLKAPLEHIHNLNSYASSTPATDGQRVFVSFLDVDKMFIAAYDFSGKQLWAVRPGKFSSVHGYCSSPVLYKDKIIVNGDHDGDGYIVALKRTNGEQAWKIDRPNHTRSYCTPLIRDIAGEPHMMLTGTKCTASYNPDTGAQQWIMQGPTEQFVAAPVYNGKLLFITAGFPELHILAIKPDGHGDVTNTAIVWRTRRGAGYVPSPAVLGDLFFNVSDGGFGSCWDADTGENYWLERLPGHHSASLLTSEDRVYFLSDRGVMTVVKADRKFQTLASNDIGEETYASPIVSQGQIFLRGVDHLWCIGKSK